MEKRDLIGEIKEQYASIKMLNILFNLLPIMEIIDKLHITVNKKEKRLKKYRTDINYLAHEMEMLEMDSRIYESLMKKRHGNRCNKEYISEQVNY